MKFLRRIQKGLAEFCASISQFPVETALCLFTFVLSVALCEMNQRNWMEDSYFFKRFAPVSLLYVAAVFSIAFSIRMRRRKPVQQRKINVVYWLSGLLVLIPQFFFDSLRRKHIFFAATRRRRQGALFRERPLQPRAAGGEPPAPQL